VWGAGGGSHWRSGAVLERAKEGEASMHALGWLRRHLQVKVLSCIVVILIAGFGVLGVWNIRMQSAVLLEQRKEAARGLADAIVKSIESGMLEGRPDIIRVLSRRLHTVKEVEDITIFRTNGVEAFADLATLEQVQRDASLEPEVVDKIRRLEARPTRTMSHPLFQQAVARVETQELFETVNGVPVFTLLHPLRNASQCQKCHGRDHQVRGVASISTSMVQTTAALLRNRNQQALVALLTIVGVALTLSVTMRRVVLRPISDLAAAAQRIGRGDFSGRVPVTIEDEIGALAAAVNQMAVHLQRSYTELEQKAADHAAMAAENAALYAQVRQHAEVLEARVAARTRELEVANRHKSEFLANVSHELRTPLTAIKGFVDNMLDGLTGEMTPQQLRYLTRIKANTDRLARLINDLLDLTRIEAGRLELRPTTLLLTPLVTEVVASLRPMAEDKHIQLAVAAADPDATAWADRDKVTQVLMNLLGNALKFTPAHGHITVTIARDGTGSVRIAVTDTGPGIATEEAAKIFDQFYQVAHAGTQRPHGTGLGLAIAKALVEMQHGRLWVESVVGRGSTFAFTLPVLPPVTPAEATHAEGEHGAEGADRR
jgi:signal transduction histidine kinase